MELCTMQKKKKKNARTIHLQSAKISSDNVNPEYYPGNAIVKSALLHWLNCLQCRKLKPYVNIM